MEYPKQNGWKSINDMAQHYDITLRALRFYEARGLLAPIRIGMKRFYSTGDCIRLELIMKAKRLGFTLGEIKILIEERASRTVSSEQHVTTTIDPDDILRRINLLTRKREEVEAALAILQDALASQSAS